MRFAEIPTREAEGAILGHSVKHAEGVFKKGRLLSAGDVAALAGSGVETVHAALLDADDVPEDEAASRIARAIAGPGAMVQQPFTGRSNLHAAHHGLVVLDAERVKAFNRVHESLTLATAAPFEVVAARQLVATVKIIPFAVPRAILSRALAAVGGDPFIRVEEFKHKTAGLIITRLPQTKSTILAKSEAAIRTRIAALDGELGEVLITGHAIEAVREAIARLHRGHHHPILIFGASAIVDRGDVIPAAVVAAGGEVVHLGMPVDPGNLLMFGRLEGTPVIGVPSCARSPKINGFDWLLQRIMAGLHVSGEDIMDMGAGGLLTEIHIRPSPREGDFAKAQMAPEIVAIVLAAGRSTRMGSNKLLSDVGGGAMIRKSVEGVLGSSARPVIVVTGHEADKVRAALAGLPLTFVHNADFAGGLSGSLKAGIRAVPAAADGALICLGDMPFVGPSHIDRLVSAFAPAEQRTIIVPVHDGARGNPVLWGRSHFAEMMELEGDQGARVLIDAYAGDLVEVAMSSDAVLTDFDTPESLARLKSA